MCASTEAPSTRAENAKEIVTYCSREHGDGRGSWSGNKSPLSNFINYRNHSLWCVKVAPSHIYSNDAGAQTQTQQNKRQEVRTDFSPLDGLAMSPNTPNFDNYRDDAFVRD
jgi:hypothetical protein